MGWLLKVYAPISDISSSSATKQIYFINGTNDPGPTGSHYTFIEQLKAEMPSFASYSSVFSVAFRVVLALWFWAEAITGGCIHLWRFENASVCSRTRELEGTVYPVCAGSLSSLSNWCLGPKMFWIEFQSKSTCPEVEECRSYFEWNGLITSSSV